MPYVLMDHLECIIYHKDKVRTNLWYISKEEDGVLAKMNKVVFKIVMREVKLRMEVRLLTHSI